MIKTLLIAGCLSLLPAVWEFKHVSKRRGRLWGSAAGAVVFLSVFLWLRVSMLFWDQNFADPARQHFWLVATSATVVLPSAATALLRRRFGLTAGVVAGLVIAVLVWIVTLWVSIATWGL
ncbi:hypothetical protein [Rhizobium sp. AAP43]|uniref:hypothetical protein n=1 Tax=Rhizobium sp. AAP43 TaxID=1523420 RepID=UPI0006B89CFE|nr:hypothetical protein [Rhizobium sp. AAP43]KPF41086.1 hypothetical protein IP76_22190 [Rhizobium sp. AAP43]